MMDWRYNIIRGVEVEPNVFFERHELGDLCHLRNTEIARLTARAEEAERRLEERTMESQKFQRDAIEARAEREAVTRKLAAVLEMLVPKHDDHDNPPFFCEGCFWMGHDIVLGGTCPQDEYTACPECSDSAEEITKFNRNTLAAIHDRAVAIAEGRGDE